MGTWSKEGAGRGREELGRCISEGGQDWEKVVFEKRPKVVGHPSFLLGCEWHLRTGATPLAVLREVGPPA